MTSVRRATHRSSPLDYKLAGASEILLTRHLNHRFPPLDKEYEPVPMDNEIRKLAEKYAVDREDFNSTISYLEEMNYGNRRVPEMTDKAIAAFAAPHRNDFRWNRNMARAVETAKLAFNPMKRRLKVLSFNTLEEIRDAIPREDTHAGFPYLETGKRLKGEYVDQELLAEFTDRTKQALKDGTYNQPIMTGFRLQSSGSFDDFGNRTGTFRNKERTVSMVSIWVILAELKFSKSVQHLFENSRLYAGGKTPAYLNRIIGDMRARHVNWISLDYSSFDQSIPGWLIESAFDVIRSWFDLTPMEGDLFEVVVNDFINKSIISREGKLTVAKDGVPSGSMFTSIIDTICNFIMIQTYWYSIGRDDSPLCNICGDDNLIFYNFKLEKEDLCSYINHNFGITVDPFKSTDSSKQYYPSYLSREWRSQGIYREPHHLVAKMTYPERFRDYKRNVDLKPELIFYSYLLSYDLSMREYFDIPRFMEDYKLSLSNLSPDLLAYLSGFFAFQARYLVRPLRAT